MYLLFIVLLCAGLLGTMFAALELGRWLGARQRRAHPEAGEAGLGAMDGAVFALLGLLIAFTFSGAGARFDRRRDLAVTEANVIRTSYSRVDLLPTDAQLELRGLYRRYVEERIAFFRKAPDLEAARVQYRRCVALQDQIWKATVAAAQRGSPPALGLVIGSLDDMINIATTRLAAMRTHVPIPILASLFGLAVLASLLAGRNLSATPRRSWLNIIVYSVVVAGSVYVILDFELPRIGLIREDLTDRLLVALLEWMS